MAAKITNIQLVAEFRRYIAEEWGYVYGGEGELYTEALAKEYTQQGRSVPKGRKKATYFTVDCAKWYGHRVADCSGGIVHAIQQYDPSFYDRKADTFKSQFTVNGKIDTIPEIIGLAVWRKGHIGVYAGNGKVLEFRGTAYGCVETELKDRDFTHWGKIKGVDYITATTTKPTTTKPTTSPSTTASPAAFFAKCSGGSVYIRSGPAKTYKAVGVARKDNLLLALPAKNSWCEVAAVIDGKIVKGYMSSTYVKKT